MGNDQLTFCDICGREILNKDEIGENELCIQVVNGTFEKKIIKTWIVRCIDCIDDEGE